MLLGRPVGAFGLIRGGLRLEFHMPDVRPSQRGGASGAGGMMGA